jgi:hypothetical protein
MDKSKMAIFSTVNNFKLYHKSSALYPLDIKSYVIDGRNGMFGIHSIIYMMKILKKKNINWVILMDEDALFINSNLVFSIIEYMKTNNYIISGVRDGGMLPERSGNPYVMNPFFSIIDLKKLKKIWNRKEMLANHYIKEEEFDEDLSNLKYPYDKKSLSEPYYCLYFWLKRKGERLLYLETSLAFKDDPITNVVHDLEGRPILYHTWFSREYGDKRARHTARIDRVFDKFKSIKNERTKTIIYKDFMFPIKNRFRRFKKNTIKRISLIREKLISI